MKRYKTIDTVQLFSGLIGLDAQQAKSRLQVGQITPAGVGTYEIMKPVQFKAGEVILLTDPKGVMRFLECLDIDLPADAGDEPVIVPAADADASAAVPEAPAGPGRPRIVRGGRK